MKISSVLKVLGAAAAVAALTPYEVEKNEETGVTTMKALLWGAKYTPATGETGRDVDVTLGLNVPKLAAKKESELFADDDPDAAVPDLGDLQVTAGLDELQVTVDEAADEAQEAACEAAEAAGPDDFDPELC